MSRRPEGAAFAVGWAAAGLGARDRLAGDLLDRAIYGIEEVTERFSEEEKLKSLTKRRRHVPSLGLAMLARLDHAVETRARAGEAMLAQIVAGDWAGFLALFDLALPDGDESGRGAALACWLAGRDNRANPLARLWKDTPIAREVAQFSADPDEEPETEPTPEEAAEAMTIWRDEEKQEWRTNFPPPDDFLGIEDGSFGDEDYERTLEPDEEEAMEAAHRAATAPLRRAGEAAPRALLALPTPANDAKKEEEEISHKGTKAQRNNADPRRQAP